uniref:GPI mannosyltransferase 2 n=1 Tax=Paramormyrops kingsleyae TaxID=1676925 RepID=A0A3B3Q6W1_9TELE|nr:GPI mannosyltransferase 2 [Paramormyrops kingsleyae]
MGIKIAVRFAAFTRVLTLLLQAVFNAVIPDHTADAFSPPRLEDPLLLDSLVEMLFGGLSRWDAEHFLFIAERGYLYEHNFAFFPLFPVTLRTLAGILLWPLAGILTARGRLLLAVVLANFVFSVIAAVALYRLGCLVLGERRLALLSSLLFCLSPANVFLAAGYSESLFAVLTFSGLWMLEGGCPFTASVLLGLATATRANGLVNVGFLLYLPLRWGLVQAIAVSKGAGGLSGSHHYILISLRFLFTATLGSAIIVIPFAAFQYYGYQTFCTPSLLPDTISSALLDLARVKGYRIPDAKGLFPSWCTSRPPLLYSYIQDVYWDVGFLRYFQLKQIPNFLLALPMATLGVAAIKSYISANWDLCLRLGLWGGQLKPQTDIPSGYHNPKVFVYMVHLTVLLGFGVFCMHVQVLTRFLASSSPVIYWFSAHLLLCYEPLLKEDGPSPDGGRQDRMDRHPRLLRADSGVLPHNPLTWLLFHGRTCSPITRWVLGYFISYWLIGLALHCNFLPWT